jgi:signal peptidase I
MARRAPTFVAVAVALAAMYFLWPARFGGGTSYVITSGVSMEPRFHSGDLAILRRADRYRVGEIAGYHSGALHVTVLHRIVERRGDRFIFKGDHNTWRDDDRTTQADILGRLWVRIPHGGILLRLARQPAVLLFVGGLVALGGTSGGRRRRRAGGPRAPASAGRLDAVGLVSAHLPDGLRRPPPQAALAATAIGMVALTLTAVTWAVPARVERSRLTPFEQRATLSYQARVAPDAVYPSGSLEMPDPVFLSLVPAIDVTVRYDAGRPLAARVPGIGGSHAVVADLRGSNGWHRRFTLQAETTFTGRSFSVTAELPLGHYLQLIEDVEQLTKASSGPYSITVSAVVMLGGQVPGGVVAGDFSPSLTFDLTPSQLRLHDQVPPGAAFVTKSQATSIAVPATAVRRLPMPGHPTVSTARTAGAALAVVALLAAGLLTGLRRRAGAEAWVNAGTNAEAETAARAETAEIAEIVPRRYRGRVLATQITAIPPDRTVVRVGSIEVLHKIAERYGRFILHDVSPAPGATAPGTSRARRRSTDQVRGREHTFLVDDDTALYLFVTHGPAPAGDPGPTDPAPPQESGPHDLVPAPRHASS